MGSSMYLNRKLIPKRPRTDVICEFTGMISSLGIQFEYENEHTLYLWKHSRWNGIRVYVDSAKPVDYPEPFGRYYREVFFDAVYHDEDCMNTDLLLEITAAYMQKYPDALLFGEECSPYLYYDKEDIDAVTAKSFDKDWFYLTKSHISPLYDDVYAQWREERRKS